MKHRHWVLAFSLLLLTSLAFAALPQTISYQGYLKNSTTGAPVSGTVRITFRLYSTGTPLNPLWTGTPHDVAASNGIYITQIGPVALPFDRQYWLGVDVAGTELTPLQPLHSVPYALNAALPATSTYTSSGNAFEITNSGSGTAIKGSGSGGNNGTLGGTAGVVGSSVDYYSGVLGQNSANGVAVEGFSTGSGTAVLGHTNGIGKAGMFAIENSLNTDSALYVSTVGTGSAGRFYTSNPVASGSTLFTASSGGNKALEVSQYGTGYSAYFLGNEPANPYSVVFVDTKGSGTGVSINATGTGMAASFSQLNSLNNVTTLYASNQGQGGVINATSLGNSSYAVADFIVNNPAASQSVVQATTNGTGKAGDFRNTNNSNSSPAINSFTNGTGPAGSFAINNPASSSTALSVSTNGSGYAIQGASTSSVGIVGSSNTNTGVWGIADGGTGVDGLSKTGVGIVGRSGGGVGIMGTTGSNVAIYGINNSKDSPAIEGWNQGGGDIFRGWSGPVDSQALMFSIASNGALFAAGGITYPDGSKQVTAKSDCLGGRYEDNGNGTVSDCRTGLVWLKNANCTDNIGLRVKSSGYLTWYDANSWVIELGNGYCGLTDGSSRGDWRMPTKTEWMAMVASARKQGFANLALTNSAGIAKWTPGDPFNNVLSANYWSSTGDGFNNNAWCIYTNNGIVSLGPNLSNYYVWPVRAGQ